jgi:hypothetical protein
MPPGGRQTDGFMERLRRLRIAWLNAALHPLVKKTGIIDPFAPSAAPEARSTPCYP